MDELIQLIISLPTLRLPSDQENALADLISKTPPKERNRHSIKFLLAQDQAHFRDAKIINLILDYLATWEMLVTETINLQMRLAAAWKTQTQTKIGADDFQPLGELYIELPTDPTRLHLLKENIDFIYKIDYQTEEGYSMAFLWSIITQKLKRLEDINRPNQKEETIELPRTITLSHPLLGDGEYLSEEDKKILEQIETRHKNIFKEVIIALRKEDREHNKKRQQQAEIELENLLSTCASHLLTVDSLIRSAINIHDTDNKSIVKKIAILPTSALSLFSSSNIQKNKDISLFGRYLDIESREFTYHPDANIAKLQNELIILHRIILIASTKNDPINVLKKVNTHLLDLLKTEKNNTTIPPLTLLQRSWIATKSIGRMTWHTLGYVNPLQLLSSHHQPTLHIQEAHSVTDLFKMVFSNTINANIKSRLH